MYLEDYIRLVVAIRDTAEALRREADYVADPRHADLLRDRAGACERRAAEMEENLPVSHDRTPSPSAVPFRPS